MTALSCQYYLLLSDDAVLLSVLRAGHSVDHQVVLPALVDLVEPVLDVVVGRRQRLQLGRDRRLRRVVRFFDLEHALPVLPDLAHLRLEVLRQLLVLLHLLLHGLELRPLQPDDLGLTLDDRAEALQVVGRRRRHPVVHFRRRRRRRCRRRAVGVFRRVLGFRLVSHLVGRLVLVSVSVRGGRNQSALDHFRRSRVLLHVVGKLQQSGNKDVSLHFKTDHGGGKK